jgi:uncharacterized protein with HEPN domain
MRRDVRVYLWDIREAAAEIAGFIHGMDRAGYDASALVRAAVERKFEIIGEAMTQLARFDPALAARIPDFRQAISFRNLLIHGYRRIDHGAVWRIATTSLPALHAGVAALLDELGPP